jgi:hypothetical protein
MSAEPVKLFPSSKRMSIVYNENIASFKNKTVVRNHAYIKGTKIIIAT